MGLSSICGSPTDDAVPLVPEKNLKYIKQGNSRPTAALVFWRAPRGHLVSRLWYKQQRLCRRYSSVHAHTVFYRINTPLPATPKFKTPLHHPTKEGVNTERATLVMILESSRRECLTEFEHTHFMESSPTWYLFHRSSDIHFVESSPTRYIFPTPTPPSAWNK